jgi:hypothetical protein
MIKDAVSWLTPSGLPSSEEDFTTPGRIAQGKN